MYSTPSSDIYLLRHLSQIKSSKTIVYNLFTFSSLVAQMVRICLQCWRPRFDPYIGNIPWRREWQPDPVFMPGKSHGQRSPAGYSPRGHKELDTTEQLSTQIIQIRSRRKWRGTRFCPIPAVSTLHHCVLLIIVETDGLARILFYPVLFKPPKGASGETP